MGKTLIITEKLSVACKVAAAGRKILGDFIINGTLITNDYLSKNDKKVQGMVSRQGKLENDNYIIMYAVGHLCGLAQAYDYNPSYKNWRNIPSKFYPEEFKLIVSKSTKNVFDNLNKAINSKDVKDIIVATDADREGQAIFELISTMTNNKKPTKRLWADAFTDVVLEKAFKNMKDNKDYINLTKAGSCRMKSDWVLGALLSAKATTQFSSGKDIISVGRVQTAVLAEIVRIEDLIKNFDSKKFYQIVGTFKTKGGEIYQGVYEEKFDDLKLANNLINKLSNIGKISSYETTKENKYCPPLYDQTSLQIDMSTGYGLSPDQTLASSQSLYVKAHQTYPRTGSRYITKGEASDFETMLRNAAKINPLALKYPFNKNNKRIVDDKKVESHSAIIPTIDIPNLSSLDKNDRIVYESVLKRAIAVNFPPAIDEKSISLTNVSGFDFKSNGKKEIERGWREVYDIKVDNNSLPSMKINDDVQVLKLEAKEVVTKPPSRYTEATILKFMETCGKKIEDEEMRELMKDKGIGTSATRAEIINKLKSTGYVLVKGKTLYPTEKGINTINILPIDELKSAEFTGQIEYKLSLVEKGKMSDIDFMKEIKNLYFISVDKIESKGSSTKIISNVDNSLGKCPVCKQGDIVHRKGKTYDFYGCSNFKGGCKFSIGEIANKKLTENQVKTLLKKGETGTIKGFKKKDGTELPSAKLILKNGKVEIKW